MSPREQSRGSPREISPNVNQLEMGSKWGRRRFPDEIRRGQIIGTYDPVQGENIFSTSRPSPIDSVIDHSAEAWNRRKQSTGAFELSH